MGKVPEPLRNRLGIAVAKRTYKAYRELLASPRWQRAYNAGARPQRLLWASTGTKDPKASDVLYVKALAAPFTVNTMPEGTLKALADHGEVGPLLPPDGGDCEAVLAEFAKAGVDIERSGRPAPGRRREVVRKVLERADGGDCVQERRSGEGRLGGVAHERSGCRCGGNPRQNPRHRANATIESLPRGRN